MAGVGEMQEKSTEFPRGTPAAAAGSGTEGARSQGMQEAPGSENNSRPTARKETEVSILQLPGTEFRQPPE